MHNIIVKYITSYFRRFRKICKKVNFVMSVRPSVLSAWNTMAATERIFIKLIFVDFSKMCRENSSFLKI